MSEGFQRNNPSGRLSQSYPAVIENTVHPDGLYLAQVRLLGWWDNIPVDDLPWAEFLLPLGAKKNAGHCIPVEIGDYVWVDFPRNGDTRYPRITGSLYHAPGGVSNLPGESFNNAPYEQKRHPDEPTAPSYSPKDDIYQRFGLMEHKTHEGGWCITSKATGTAIEITPKGQIVIHCEADSFRSSTGNTTENVGGNLVIKVVGSASIECKDASVKASGAAKIEAAGDIDISAGGGVNIQAGAPFMVKAPSADFQLG